MVFVIIPFSLDKLYCFIDLMKTNLTDKWTFILFIYPDY
jgi:hypothetical protein